MTENKKELKASFQKWLDSKPHPSLIASQCVHIASDYLRQELEEIQYKLKFEKSKCYGPHNEKYKGGLQSGIDEIEKSLSTLP